MYLVLTDLLTCPHCGPDQGLIVLAERMENRRVLDGTLGCPACQRHFLVCAGLADLRLQPESARANAADTGGPLPDTVRLGTMLGLAEQGGFTLLMGRAARVAAELAALVPGLEVIVIGAQDSDQEQTGVSRLLVDAALPLRSGALRSILLSEDVPTDLHGEVLRVLAVGGRLVLTAGIPGAQELATAPQLRTLARDAHHIVLLRAH